MLKILYILLLSIIGTELSFAQIYVEKKSRHRFAQLNLGIDVQSSFFGDTKYKNIDGITRSLSLKSMYSPRILIGGTHFWGHADFYIAIPFFYSKPYETNNQKIETNRGVETVFKFYPKRIKNGKFRPYVGASLAPFYFEQSNKNFDFSNGPELDHTSVPLLGGFTYNSKNQLFEMGLAWNYANRKKYYISRSEISTINTPHLYLSFSYRVMLETTVSAEKDWESGKTERITKKLGNEGILDGFYMGVGMSSAFWLKRSSYNILNRPYIEKYDISLMPDFTLGYYFHNPDLNLAVGYRGYSTSTNTYGAVQQINRRSYLVEATKFLFDYHGFVPFVGPVISYDRLSFNENFETVNIWDIEENKLSVGLTFGWDIRPNRIQSWILKTNLRWYPNLYLNLDENNKISFDAIEFNFIQLIVYLNRIKN